MAKFISRDQPGAMHFDGATNFDSACMFDTTTADWTLSLWFKYMGDFSAQASIISQQDGGGGTGRSVMDIPTTRILRSFYGNTSTGTFVVERATWYNYIITFNSTTGALAGYVGDRLGNINTNGSGTVTGENAQGAWVIGSGKADNLYFTGYMTDIKLFSGLAMSVTEAQDLYFRDAFDTTKLDQFEYLFSDGSGNTITDTSSGSNNATKDQGTARWITQTPFKAKTLG